MIRERLERPKGM